MFYSHEVLTSSKYGVATVWLVATLGSDSARRRVNRTEILNVNVPKACETITSTDTPLALRLQSNLLYGVSKVYSQQCSFVLIDAEHARTQVRNAMNTLRTSTTTEHKSYKATRNHITSLSHTHMACDDDGDYIPGLADFRNTRAGDTVLHDSLFTVESIMSQSYLSDETSQQLQILSDDNSADVDFNAISPARGSSFSGDQGIGTSVHVGSHLFDALEAQVLDDVGLNIDEDGNIYDRQVEDMEGKDTTGASVHGTTGIHIMDETLMEDYMLPGEEAHLELLEQAQPFSPRRLAVSSELTPPPSATEEIPSSVAAAANRAARKLKTLQLDLQMELTNAELAAAERDYTSHMTHLSTVRYNRGGLALARVNADTWVLGCLGAVGGPMAMTVPAQLQLFTGNNILNILLGSHSSHTGSKRASEAEGDERRVRARPNEDEVARHDDPITLPEEDLLLGGDPSLEIGRELGTPLADQRSSMAMHMPWNIHSSTRGSSVRMHHSAGLAGVGSSVAGGGISIGFRGSSAAASPLGKQSHSADLARFEERHDEEDTLAQQDHDPRDQVATWLNQSQDPEASNFLQFIREAIEEEGTGKVAFESMLPPDEHDKIVAAQGLMHVLSLVGQGRLTAHQTQDEPFRPVQVALV